MNPLAPDDDVEVVLFSPALPIPPDETGLPPGFSPDRVRRLFSSRVVLADPPEAELAAHPPVRPGDPVSD